MTFTLHGVGVSHALYSIKFSRTKLIFAGLFLSFKENFKENNVLKLTLPICINLQVFLFSTMKFDKDTLLSTMKGDGLSLH